MTNRTRTPRCRPGRRRGTSLIEVVVMMSVAVVMLGIAMTTIHLLLRAERHATQAVWHNTTIARLSRVLRSDIHAAREAVVQAADDDGPAALNLTLQNDRRVAYTIEEHELRRVESAGETVKRRHAFFLPPGSSLRFEQPAGSTMTIRLVIERAPLTGRRVTQTKHATGEPPARRTLTIQSIVGRSHRFTRGGERGE